MTLRIIALVVLLAIAGCDILPAPTADLPEGPTIRGPGYYDDLCATPPTAENQKAWDALKCPPKR